MAILLAELAAWLLMRRWVKVQEEHQRRAERIRLVEFRRD
jgi:hypothetical protein